MNKNRFKHLIFAIGVASIPLVLWCLDTPIKDGYFGPIVQKIYTDNRDASGIFWTDVESSKEQ